MKKIVTLILLLCLVLTLAACGKVEITMQEIYDASQTEALLKNHESVYIQSEMGGELFGEKYLTEANAYTYFSDEEFEYAEFMTDDASYAYSDGDYLRYLYIAPEGVTNDFTSDRAAYYEATLGEEILDETIEAVSKKDGRITVNSTCGQETLAEMAELGITSYKAEYTLDAKTRDLISVITVYTNDDGTADQAVTKVVYDTEAPEMLKVFQEYENQTDDLRNVTVVSNPGTEQEVSQDFRIPKGLIIGFSWEDAFTDKVELYTDAACTESYDPYVNTESDLTVYVKWAE